MPVYEALQVIGNKLHNDDILAEQSALQVKATIALLHVLVIGKKTTLATKI
jgi:hypothetical protein